MIEFPSLPEPLERVRDRYSERYVIVSPPRCCSTALARVFWEHPSIAYYCHEPFEIAHFRGASLEEVSEKLLDPLELEDLTPTDPGARGLVVKEMPYQVRHRFPQLASLATAPIVFLVRDPRLNIASRMSRKREVGDSPIFPLEETGWELLADQVAHCRDSGIPYLILTAADLRERPLDVLPQLFERLGLVFDDDLISWRPCAEIEIDNLDGEHSHLYRKVLASDGIQPETAALPKLDRFPTEGGFREHVVDCLEIYSRLTSSPRRLQPA